MRPRTLGELEDTHASIGYTVEDTAGMRFDVTNQSTPESWRRCFVEDVAASERNALVGGPFGSNLVSKDYTDAGIPVIRGQNMIHGRWIDGEFAFVSEQKAAELAANTARAGDLVFTQRGTLGQVAMVPDHSHDRFIISQSQMKLTVDRDKADPSFVYYLFSSAQMQQYIRANAIQTGVPHTNLGFLRRTPLLLPPLDEQRAIAHILGTLDDKIELNRRMNRTLEEMARTLFTSWFVTFDPVRAKAEGRQPEGMDAATAALFPSVLHETDLGEIPGGWRIEPLAQYMDLNPRYSLRSGEIAPYLDMANVPTKGPRAISWRDRPAGSGARFRNGDVLLARITPCLENGKSALVDFLSAEQVGWGSTEFIVMRAREPFSSAWAYCLVRHPDFRAFATRAMSGTSGRQRVSAEAVGRYLIAVPQASVAPKFAEIVDPLFKEMRQLDEESRTLAHVRDLLLLKLLSGELEVST